MLHAGNLGFYGAWDTLLKAAEILRNEGNTGLVFIGDGANRKALEASAANLPNVRFLPFRPVEQVPHVMMAGDIHIVTVKRGLEGVVVRASSTRFSRRAGRCWRSPPKESDAARIVTEADAAWRPIRTIRPQWPRRSGSFAAIPRGSPKWAGARKKPQKNMLE